MRKKLYIQRSIAAWRTTGSTPVGGIAQYSAYKKKERYKIMARKRMVTRTVEQTTAQVMTIDVTTAEVQVRTYDIGGKYTDEDLLKNLQKIFQSGNLKLVHIESQSCKEVLLGMDEEDFIRLAKVLPPRATNKDED